MASRAIAPAALVLAVALALMGYYFHQVTGSFFVPPYLVYTKSYDPIPLFPWPHLGRIPAYNHAVIKAFYMNLPLSTYLNAREHPVETAFWRFLPFTGFFLGPLLVTPLLVLILAGRVDFFRGLLRPTKARFLLLLSVPPLVGVLLPTYFSPHYAAPLAGALFALIVIAMRHLELWTWRGRAVGSRFVRAVPPLACLIMVIHSALWMSTHGLFPVAADFGRGQILHQLQNQSGQHLVVVHYEPKHDPGDEWVFNAADIDGSKVVWAHDMGPTANEELLKYFKNRRAWLLEADDLPPKLLPYAASRATD